MNRGSPGRLDNGIAQLICFSIVMTVSWPTTILTTSSRRTRRRRARTQQPAKSRRAAVPASKELLNRRHRGDGDEEEEEGTTTRRRRAAAILEGSKAENREQGDVNRSRKQRSIDRCRRPEGFFRHRPSLRPAVTTVIVMREHAAIIQNHSPNRTSPGPMLGTRSASDR